MAMEIDVKYCRACGALESISSVLHKDGSRTVTAACRCGAGEERITTVPAGETYMLRVETRLNEEAEQHDDPDSGDVQAGG